MADSLSLLDATAQAELVRRGEVKPLELVDAAIARIEKLDPELGSVITRQFERARAWAVASDLPAGPFRGVPMLLKDLGAHLAGDPVHCGMRALKKAGWREPGESYFAERLRLAGLISLGRTNTPELGLLPTTEPEAYGPTRNPWKPTHSSGGSSGGSAAAVAAGLVAAAHASDGGGSIRIPASHCGLVGLKPTRGRGVVRAGDRGALGRLLRRRLRHPLRARHRRAARPGERRRARAIPIRRRRRRARSRARWAPRPGACGSAPCCARRATSRSPRTVATPCRRPRNGSRRSATTSKRRIPRPSTRRKAYAAS